jgi:hypothetical protein
MKAPPPERGGPAPVPRGAHDPRGLRQARMSICNMAIEAGARAGMIAPDEKTVEYIEGRPLAPKGAEWEKAKKYWATLKSDEVCCRTAPPPPPGITLCCVAVLWRL